MWNVKCLHDTRSNRGSSINRNIVECKAGHGEQTKRNELSINRNIVECKGDCGSESFVRVPCINRNIVECKVEVYNVTDLVRLRINRNIVECKDSFFDCPLVPLLVLIETLWNVKSVDHLQVDFSLRINRNIVECKVGIALTCLECSG